MRVLITGGTGFVGLTLAEKLLGSGHEVVFFDLREPPAQFTQAIGDSRSKVHVETGDVGSTNDLARVFDKGGITHVFHGAAITAGPARETAEARRIVEVNLSATINMVQTAAHAGVQRLVFPSSLTVYGEHLYGTAPLDEEITPAVPKSLYAITKYAAERAALEVGGRSGLDVVCGRIGAVFGPWETDTQARDLLSPYHQVTAAAARGVPAILPQVYASREMIYSRDLAQALVLLLSAERPAYSVYNLSVNANWDGLLPKWCETLTHTMPGFEWRYAAPGEASNILFPDNRPRTTMQTHRLRDDLQFSPRFLPDAALSDYATWLSANRSYFY
jgi:nucleoside-diphosphate-sugar epimerase